MHARQMACVGSTGARRRADVRLSASHDMAATMKLAVIGGLRKTFSAKHGYFSLDRDKGVPKGVRAPRCPISSHAKRPRMDPFSLRVGFNPDVPRSVTE